MRVSQSHTNKLEASLEVIVGLIRHEGNLVA